MRKCTTIEKETFQSTYLMTVYYSEHIFPTKPNKKLLTLQHQQQIQLEAKAFVRGLFIEGKAAASERSIRCSTTLCVGEVCIRSTRVYASLKDHTCSSLWPSNSPPSCVTRELKTYAHTEICTAMFTGAFTITSLKSRSKPRSLAEEQTVKSGSQATEHYLAKKRVKSQYMFLQG